MDNFEPCKGLSSSNPGRGEADEGPSRALQGKTPDLEIAPNVLFFADEAPANNVRDPDTKCMRIHDHSLRRIHITTNLMLAAANGAGFLLTELAWAPLTPSSRSACCYRTASINLPSTFRVENKTNTGPWIAEHPKGFQSQ
jgi:hypothetical protein